MEIKIPSKLKPLLEPIEGVRVNPRNMRSGHSVDAIVASLREFGWHAPLVALKNGDVLVGNGRLKAALELGLKQVPVIRVADSQTKAARRMFSDNRTSELSVWDVEMMAEYRDELVGLDEAYLLSDVFDLEAPVVEPTPPDDFPEVDESIETNSECPKCGYRWNE